MSMQQESEILQKYSSQMECEGPHLTIPGSEDIPLLFLHSDTLPDNVKIFMVNVCTLILIISFNKNTPIELTYKTLGSRLNISKYRYNRYMGILADSSFANYFEKLINKLGV